MSRKQSLGRSDVRVVELARGGMGAVEVVLRQDGDFSRLMAVKRLLPEHHQNEDFRAMFLSEARVAGLLRHPNIVSVLDVGEDEDGPFLVMDYIEGLSVSRLLKATNRTGRMLPVQICLRIAHGVAAGLHAAHELRSRDGQALQLVHRDVTPQNVLISYDGEILVADFGIAKVMGQTNTTSTGVLKGKLGYMSPEQLKFREPDRRSDLFSLGVVLFELLSNERAYGGKGTEGARRILEEPPPDILEFRDDVDDAIVALLFDLLAKDPEDRPATAELVGKRVDGAIAALLVDEDAMSMKAYLDEHFADERAISQAKMENAVADAKLRSQIRIKSKTKATNTNASKKREWTRARRIGAASFLCIAVAGVGFAYQTWGSSSAEATETQSARVVSPAIERAQDHDPMSPPVEITSGVEAPRNVIVEAPASEPADSDSEEPSSEPHETMRASSMARRSRRRARRTTQETVAMAPASMEAQEPERGNVFVTWEAGE